MRLVKNHFLFLSCIAMGLSLVLSFALFPRAMRTSESSNPLPIGFATNLTTRATASYILKATGFNAKLTSSLRRQLEAIGGIRFVDARGRNEAIVELSAEGWTRLNKFCAQANAVNKSTKLSVESDSPADKRFANVKPGIITITPLANEDLDVIERAIAKAGGKVIARGGVKSRPTIRANVDFDQLAGLIGRADIHHLENYVQPRFSNNVAGRIVGVDSVRATSDVGLGLTGAGQYIIVSDSGIDTGDKSTMHADLVNNVVGFETVEGCNEQDLIGHGTHVAGSIVGTGVRSDGEICGMAPGAKIWAWQCGSDEDSVSIPAYMDNLFSPAGFKAILPNEEAFIHNASWGGDMNIYNSMSAAIDRYIWENPCILPIFSAGNEGVANSISSEAGAKNVLAVGSTESYRLFSGSTNDYCDNTNSIAGFSSRGPMPDGRIKPDVVAPGSYILSTKSSVMTGKAWRDYNDYYVYMGGTSMSTPIVSGSAALVREWLVNERGFAKPSAALLRAVLTGGADDLFMTVGNNVNSIAPSNDQGWGRINLAASLTPDGGRAVYLADFIPFSEGSNVVFEVVTTNTAPLDIQLVWIDYPASAGATSTLINDLDLVVTLEDDDEKKIWFGNGGERRDIVNNSESVRINSAHAGKYTIQIDSSVVRYDSGEGGAAALYMRGAFNPDEINVATGKMNVAILKIANDKLAGDCEPFYGSHSLLPGTEVTLQAADYAYSLNDIGVEHARHQFAGWSGAGDIPATGTVNTLTVTITNDSSIVWHWNKDPSDYLFAVYSHTPGHYLAYEDYLGNFYEYGYWYHRRIEWKPAGSTFTIDFQAVLDIPNAFTFKGYDWPDSSMDGWEWVTHNFHYSFASYSKAGDLTYYYLMDENGTALKSKSIVMDEGCEIWLWYYPENEMTNGVPSWWYAGKLHVGVAYNGADGDQNADPDGDGFSNIAEYKIDTDPLDAESKLAIDNFTVTNIAWRGGESVPQVLESTTDLNVGEWKPVATNIGSISTFPIDNAFSTSNRFYRIVVPTELQR